MTDIASPFKATPSDGRYLNRTLIHSQISTTDLALRIVVQNPIDTNYDLPQREAR
jgi:hypothetical protein